MRTVFVFTWITAVAFCMAQSSNADTSELMKRHAEHVLEINEAILEQLPALPNNSQVQLKADVVQRDGHTEVKIRTIEIQDTAKKSSVKGIIKEEEIPFAKNKSEHLISYGPVVTKSEGEKASENTNGNTQESGGAAALGNFVDSNANFKAIPLDKEAVKKIAPDKDYTFAGAALIFWEK